MTANDITRGNFAVVEEVIEAELCLYCQDLGLFSGKTLRLVHKAPFGGLLAFQLGETIISLRRDEAKLIKVRQISDGKL